MRRPRLSRTARNSSPPPPSRSSEPAFLAASFVLNRFRLLTPTSSGRRASADELAALHRAWTLRLDSRWIGWREDLKTCCMGVCPFPLLSVFVMFLIGAPPFGFACAFVFAAAWDRPSDLSGEAEGIFRISRLARLSSPSPPSHPPTPGPSYDDCDWDMARPVVLPALEKFTKSRVLLGDRHVRRGCLRASARGGDGRFAASIKDGWKPRQRQGDEGHRRTALTPPPGRAPTRNLSPIFIHLIGPWVPLRSPLFPRRMHAIAREARCGSVAFMILDAGSCADSSAKICDGPGTAGVMLMTVRRWFSFTVARVLNVEGLLSRRLRTGDVFEVMSVGVYSFFPPPYYKTEADSVARERKPGRRAGRAWPLPCVFVLGGVLAAYVVICAEFRERATTSTAWRSSSSCGYPIRKWGGFSQRDLAFDKLLLGKDAFKWPDFVDMTGEGRLPVVDPELNAESLITRRYFSLSPNHLYWGADAGAGHAEENDILHNPDPRRDSAKDKMGNICTGRGLSNLGCLFVVVGSLATLFAGYPFITYFKKNNLSAIGGYNIGGINSTSQVPTNASLEITLSEKQTRGRDYQDGMMSSWNKFCFAGGMVEMTLPYVYDEFDVETAPNQTRTDVPSRQPPEARQISTRLSRATCPGKSHPGPIHFDGTYVGRSAPEIDIFEAQITGTPLISQVGQWAPFNEGVWDPYTGGSDQQAPSVVTKTGTQCFNVYGIEYKPGFDDVVYSLSIGLIYRPGTVTRTRVDDHRRELGASNATEISPGPVAQEPMDLIMPVSSHEPGPVRQRWHSGHNTHPVPRDHPGDVINYDYDCDPDDFPAADYINQYIEAYTNPNLTTWKDDYEQPFPKSSFFGQCWTCAGHVKMLRVAQPSFHVPRISDLPGERQASSLPSMIEYQLDLVEMC
ncbi:glycoside hydrolase family 16 protein [Athelia psychrophila]|uniref:Glycoside hydrolase family 16 protein n=1 Tax=Athelia psychrophila TaxID=1759441 RepID=A0A167V7M2_9AGAM|nr:glycoside hydrolase family 16 protein [Fibularhizoctonia sp. CBS 109695]